MGLTLYIPRYRIFRKGIIKGVPCDIPLDEIQANLKMENHQTRISNIFRLKRKESLSKKWVESQSICIEFQNSDLSKNLKIWKVNLSVSPYIPPIRRCFKCGKFGHISKGCNQDHPCCLNCGNTHSISAENPCKESPCCINCKETRHTLNRDCTKLKINKEINQVMAQDNL